MKLVNFLLFSLCLTIAISGGIPLLQYLSLDPELVFAQGNEWKAKFQMQVDEKRSSTEFRHQITLDGEFSFKLDTLPCTTFSYHISPCIRPTLNDLLTVNFTGGSARINLIQTRGYCHDEGGATFPLEADVIHSILETDDPFILNVVISPAGGSPVGIKTTEKCTPPPCTGPSCRFMGGDIPTVKTVDTSIRVPPCNCTIDLKNGVVREVRIDDISDDGRTEVRGYVKISLSGPTLKIPRVDLFDPNPKMINQEGDLINDINLVSKITEKRIGSTSDGISKLLLVAESDFPLNFTIKGCPTDFFDNPCIKSDGSLSGLEEQYDSHLTSIGVSPIKTKSGESLVVAVYTPPDSYGPQVVQQESYRTINIQVTNPALFGNVTSGIPIKLYHPPVVLVHGIWANPTVWVDSGFQLNLKRNGFADVFLADYEEHNADTFDPTVLPNHGILSVKEQIDKAIQQYRGRSIAATQADVVGHSNGGLVSRGLVQQGDYKQPSNYMEGSIHRLITIGTPHFGSELVKFLYDNRNREIDVSKLVLQPHLQLIYKLMPSSIKPKVTLGDIFRIIGKPIDQGFESLSPASPAYSHLEPTSIKSHAIAGNWAPDSRPDTKLLLEAIGVLITKDQSFSLEKLYGEPTHDINVPQSSQLGGLDEDSPQTTIVNGVIHGKKLFPQINDVADLWSPEIQKKVIYLLGSSNEEDFADEIGFGAYINVKQP